jgi:hypothetical protein
VRMSEWRFGRGSSRYLCLLLFCDALLSQSGTQNDRIWTSSTWSNTATHSSRTDLPHAVYQPPNQGFFLIAGTVSLGIKRGLAIPCRCSSKVYSWKCWMRDVWHA